MKKVVMLLAAAMMLFLDPTMFGKKYANAVFG
jgi:hypothetical protein